MPSILSLAPVPDARKSPPDRGRLNEPTVYVPPDLAASLVTQYVDLVADFTSAYSSDIRRQIAAGRLLGTRGTLLRICPPSYERTLPTKAVNKWRSAEQSLRASLECTDSQNLLDTVRSMEVDLALSGDRFISALVNGALQDDVPSQIGFLSAIDSIALHLAQRDLLLCQSHHRPRCPLPADAKMRLRIVAMTLTLNRHRFTMSLPAIQSYRQTFAITDLQAYPWWFVDLRLSERDLKWTHKRLDAAMFDWRFNSDHCATKAA